MVYLFGAIAGTLVVAEASTSLATPHMCSPLKKKL